MSSFITFHVSKFGSCVGIWFEIWNAVLVWTDIDHALPRCLSKNWFRNELRFWNSVLFAVKIIHYKGVKISSSFFMKQKRAKPSHNKIMSILRGKIITVLTRTNVLWMLLFFSAEFWLKPNFTITCFAIADASVFVMLSKKLQSKWFLLQLNVPTFWKTIYLSIWLMFKWFVATFCVCHLSEIDWLLLFIT